MNFYEKNQDLIGHLSSKYRLNRDVVEKLVSHSFLSIRECIAMEDMPNILIHNWGRFSIQPSRLEKKFLKFKEELNNNPELITEESISKIKKYLKAYERICLEEERTPINCIEELKNFINKQNEER
jgi:uncharacterized protein YbgA (DUF1722 family)